MEVLMALWELIKSLRLIILAGGLYVIWKQIIKPNL